MSFNPITGTPLSDNLFGGRRADLVRGLGSVDNINTRVGDDLIFGGAGGDYALAGEGRDRAFGGTGNDVINGGNGDDRLHGGTGDDALLGGGNDDILTGGAGNDLLYAGESPDGQHDLLFGGTGDDRAYVSDLGGGEADGGDGIDTLVLRWDDPLGPVGDVSLYLTGDGSATNSANGLTLELSGFEALYFTAGSGIDTVESGALADVIDVGGGESVVRSFGGDDWILYDTGGVNLIDAGDGHDLVSVRHSAGSALSFDVTGTTGVDNFGSLVSNAEQWRVTGNALADQVSLGNDGDGFSGAQGDDVAYGNNGDDRLRGQIGDDVLFGGNGDDLLIGGDGADSLIGGAGADRFLYRPGHDAVDTIEDFETGLDVIAIASLALENGPGRGPLDADQLSLDAAVGTHGQFVLTQVPGGDFTSLLWDANGSGAGGEQTLLTLRAAPILSVTDIFIL